MSDRGVCSECGLSAWWPLPGGIRCAICGHWERSPGAVLVEETLTRLSNPGEPAKGRHHVGARDTEEAAARFVAPRSGTQRRLCLDAFATCYPAGYTDEELSRATDLYRYSAAPRRGELLRGGWVIDSGCRRAGELGAEAIVWVLSEEGARILGLASKGQMALL